MSTSKSSLLDVYGIAPTREAAFMARWFGVGLLANGLTTLPPRYGAESEPGRAIGEEGKRKFTSPFAPSPSVLYLKK